MWNSIISCWGLLGKIFYSFMNVIQIIVSIKTNYKSYYNNYNICINVF